MLTRKQLKEIKRELPVFCESVQAVLDNKADVVVTTINAWDLKEARLFFLAMQYAYELNVPVELVPRANFADLERKEQLVS